ncbi:hypothetical protein FPOAC2_11783 [Fusarium poae]
MNHKQGIRITYHDDSQIELLNGSNRYTRENEAMQHLLAKWRITPRQPAIMCIFFICGIALAFGHHVLYQPMSGAVTRSAESQQ